MQDVFNFKIEPRCNVTMHVESHHLHHDLSMRMRLVARHFRKLGDECTHFKAVAQVYLLWEMELSVDILMKITFQAEIITKNSK